jgi:hypothetical protein
VAQARITDRQLRRTHLHKVNWGGLTPEERRVFLQDLNEPPKLKLRAPRKPSRRLKLRSPRKASWRGR